MERMTFNPELILQEIKDNQQRLDGCKVHWFPTLPAITLGAKFVCANCGGKIDALHAYAYTRGYIAAGGNGNNIIPGWSTAND